VEPAKLGNVTREIRWWIHFAIFGVLAAALGITFAILDPGGGGLGALGAAMVAGAVLLIGSTALFVYIVVTGVALLVLSRGRTPSFVAHIIGLVVVLAAGTLVASRVGLLDRSYQCITLEQLTIQRISADKARATASFVGNNCPALSYRSLGVTMIHPDYSYERGSFDVNLDPPRVIQSNQHVDISTADVLIDPNMPLERVRDWVVYLNPPEWNRSSAAFCTSQVPKELRRCCAPILHVVVLPETAKD
jgi:hypothetical protein